MYSTVLSIFYLLTCALAFLGLFVIKKSEAKLNVVLCMPVYVLVIMLYTAFFAGIIDILHIPINLLSLGMGNVIFAVGLCMCSFIKKKIQQYKFSWLDLGVFLVFVAFTILVAVTQFDLNLNINYETTDPSRHMRSAQAIIETQALSKMYYASLINAVFISVGLGFVKSFWAYKLFILADVFMFLLSALIMYVIARLYAKKTVAKLLSLVFILFYLMCYPLNNMVFGFVYLGIGVSICAYLILMSQCYANGITSKVTSVIALMLGSYGIITCYALFAPFVYVSVASFIAIEFIKQKRLFSKEFFATEFGIFLLPTVMGLYFSFFKMFGNQISEVGSAINTEGYIYRDLYSNFIIILPFAIYGLINAFVTKKVNCHHILLIIFAAITLVMFYFGLQGKISSYYYYKMYYPLSMLCFVTALEGICNLCKKSVTVIISYLLVWVFMAGMNFAKIDDKITNTKLLMSPTSSASGAFFPIVEFNLRCMENPNFSVERVQLYEQSHEKQKEGKKVTLLSTTEPIYWFEAYVQCQLKEFYCYNFDDCNIEAYMKNVEECDFVLVYTDHDERFNNYISNWKAVYQNAEGTLYSVK